MFGAETDPWTAYTSLMPIVYLLLLAMTGIVAIVYMVGNFISNDNVRAWAKSEIFEIIYSAVLFLMLYMLLPMSENVIKEPVQSMFTPQTNKLMEAAQTSEAYKVLPVHIQYSKFFLSRLFDDSVKFNFDVYQSYTWTAYLTDISIGLDALWQSRSNLDYNPLRGFFNMGNIIKREIFNFVVKVSIITKFQEVFLQVISSAVFPIFVGAGILLRSFYFTRKLGGLLMAMAIGLYFIFPMAYILAGSVYDYTGGFQKGVASVNVKFSPGADALFNPFNSIVSISKESLTPEELRTLTLNGESASESYEGVTKDLCAALEGGSDQPGTADAGAADAIGASVKNWWDAFVGEGFEAIPINDAYFDYTARLMFFSFFFSFLGLMATVAGIRSLSMLFGGDIELAGLTHLI